MYFQNSSGAMHYAATNRKSSLVLGLANGTHRLPEAAEEAVVHVAIIARFEVEVPRVLIVRP